MADNFDYAGYEASLRKTHEEGAATARQHPDANISHLEAQEFFNETLIQFSLALIRLQHYRGVEDDIKFAAVGTVLGSMEGDILSSLLRHGEVAGAADIIRSRDFASHALIQHAVSGDSPEGTLVNVGERSANFERNAE